MPFTTTPDPVTASLTDLGRMNFARAAHGEISFTATGFATGQGGYDMSNPVLITAIDPTQTTLIQQFFPNSTYPTTAIYTFTVTPASAESGATYTNNGQTFTILTTNSGTTEIVASGTGVPSLSGTLTLITGTGDATITFSSVSVIYIEPLDSVTYPTPTTCVLSCRLADTDSVTALGELGIWATITYSATTPSEVGTQFLLAVAHFPIMTKTLKQVIVYRVIIQF